MVLNQVLCQKRDEVRRRYATSPLVNRTGAIRIAVGDEAGACAVGDNRLFAVIDPGLDGIGVDVGRIGIIVAVDLDHLDTERAEGIGDKAARRSVQRVAYHPAVAHAPMASPSTISQR